MLHLRRKKFEKESESEKPGKLIHLDMVGEHIGPTSNLKIMAKPFLSPSARKCAPPHTHRRFLSSEFGSAVINKHVLRSQKLSLVKGCYTFFKFDIYAFHQENIKPDTDIRFETELDSKKTKKQTPPQH